MRKVNVQPHALKIAPAHPMTNRLCVWHSRTYERTSIPLDCLSSGTSHFHHHSSPNPPYHNHMQSCILYSLESCFFRTNHPRAFPIRLSPKKPRSTRRAKKTTTSSSSSPRKLRALLQTRHARPAARPKIDETTVGRMVNSEKGGPVEKALYRVTGDYSSAFLSTTVSAVIQRETG